MDFLKKILLWIIGLSITAGVIIVLFALYANFSDGKRAGEVIKISKKGYIFKTYEGQLNTGGFGDMDGDITSSIWHFSVKRDNQEVLDQLDNAIDGGYRVKLYYDEKYIKVPFLGETKYFVTKVEKVTMSK
ncbi:MAG: hypothetical protein KJP21_00430 [Bacteroidia bacterium]|nr:hypothetical protein [Bacteroidia bacterium]NNJ55234.1 hypothetical protein [Bacteroidia bacterium]